MPKRILLYLLLGVFLFIGAQSFWPLVNRAPHNARLANCQWNLKQIGLAVAQYAQDNDERLPAHQWGEVLLPYLKTNALFHCPETNTTEGTTDYFWNARFISTRQLAIRHPEALILLGDGQDNAPLDATIGSLPEAWRRDENSPAWRHLGLANYAFADGHVKSLKANQVTSYFRVGVAR